MDTLLSITVNSIIVLVAVTGIGAAFTYVTWLLAEMTEEPQEEH